MKPLGLGYGIGRQGSKLNKSEESWDYEGVMTAGYGFTETGFYGFVDEVIGSITPFPILTTDINMISY
jgi:hypothetical protein